MEAKLIPYYKTPLSEKEMSGLMSFDDDSSSTPHKYFMCVIGRTDTLQKELDYANPESEEIFKSIDFNFSQPWDIADEVYEDITKNFVEYKCTKSAFLAAVKEIGKGQYKEDVKLAKISSNFEESLKKCPDREQYFRSKGLPNDEAFCCAYALSFYTGAIGNNTHQSESVNRRASAFLRFGLNDEKLTLEFRNIYYYLLKALSYLPYLWGKCIRAVKLDAAELSRYEIGSLVSWIQFSSSTDSPNPPSYFKNRNTYFYIYSLNGRSIKEFSNFPDENEVLFPPFSTFLVCKKIVKKGLTEIYLRQMDIGLNKNTILWVDDQILNQAWENKALMEKFTSENGFEKNLHIIPKKSTKLSLSFLDSKIGLFLKTNKSFQFISDMSRPDEKNGLEAGALFAKEVRSRGFDHKLLIYTSNKKTAEALLMKHLGNLKNIFVTQIQKEAIEYVKKNV